MALLLCLHACKCICMYVLWKPGVPSIIFLETESVGVNFYRLENHLEARPLNLEIIFITVRWGGKTCPLRVGLSPSKDRWGNTHGRATLHDESVEPWEGGRELCLHTGHRWPSVAYREGIHTCGSSSKWRKKISHYKVKTNACLCWALPTRVY